MDFINCDGDIKWKVIAVRPVAYSKSTEYRQDVITLLVSMTMKPWNEPR